LLCIFDKLSGLNFSLRGPSATIFQRFDKVSAFMKKIMLWKSFFEDETLEMFVVMSEYIAENDYAFEEIKPHLINLKANFKNCCLELTPHQCGWM
jgi:hypothetical protein